MYENVRGILLVFCLVASAHAAGKAKPKTIAFGRWTPVKWFVGANDATALDLKVRPLMVNGDTKEFTTGEAHEITDRVFVVRRAYRLNDTLPDDSKPVPKWKWQPGGWLVVDRSTAHITKLNLPEYDPSYSAASWYRDMVAYCGVSDTGEKLYAVVAQIGRRKPILKKQLGTAKNGDLPDSECAAPAWQRQPARVTFEPNGGEKISFSIRGHAVEIAPESTDEEAETSK